MKYLLIVFLSFMLPQILLADALFQDDWDQIGVEVGISETFFEDENYTSPHVTISLAGILDIRYKWESYYDKPLSEINWEQLYSRLIVVKPSSSHPGLYLEAGYDYMDEPAIKIWDYTLIVDSKMFRYGLGVIISIHENLLGTIGIQTFEFRTQASYLGLDPGQEYDLGSDIDIYRRYNINLDYKIPFHKNIKPILKLGAMAEDEVSPTFYIGLSMMLNADLGVIGK